MPSRIDSVLTRNVGEGGIDHEFGRPVHPARFAVLLVLSLVAAEEAEARHRPGGPAEDKRS